MDRKEILEAYRKTRHFDERIKERSIGEDKIEDAILNGDLRLCMRESMRFTKGALSVVVSRDDYSLITAYKKKSMSRRERKKAFPSQRSKDQINGHRLRKKGVRK